MSLHPSTPTMCDVIYKLPLMIKQMTWVLNSTVAVKSVKCSHCMGVHGANGRFTCFIYSCPCFVFSALQLLWIESKRGHSLFLNFLLLIDWTSFFGIYYIMAPTKPSGITAARHTGTQAGKDDCTYLHVWHCVLSVRAVTVDYSGVLVSLSEKVNLT